MFWYAYLKLKISKILGCKSLIIYIDLLQDPYEVLRKDFIDY